jgi:hypothetical protein
MNSNAPVVQDLTDGLSACLPELRTPLCQAVQKLSRTSSVVTKRASPSAFQARIA